MKNQKNNTKKSEQELFLLIYGGKNTKNPPFKIGDKIKQRYTINDKNEIKDGRELYEFMGMKDNMMLLKPLNSYAFYGEDIINPKIVKKLKRKKIAHTENSILQLYYMYSDRFKIVK